MFNLLNVVEVDMFTMRKPISEVISINFRFAETEQLIIC